MSGAQLEVPKPMHIEQTGPESAAEPAERELTRREQQMLDIVANAERQRGMELAYGEEQLLDARRRAVEVDPLLEAENAAVAEEEETERARRALETPHPAPTSAPPAAAATPPAQPQPRIVMIDGAQFQVTEAQYEQLARDGMLARQTVAQYQRQSQQPAAAPAPQPPQPLLSPDEARHIAKRIQYGDEAESAQTIGHLVETIVQRMPRQQLDPNAIIHAAVQQSQQQQTLQRNLEMIGSEYPDIFKDRTLSQLAALKLGEIRTRNQALGVVAPDLETYREACGIVMGAISPREQQLQPADATSTALQAAQPSRLERKRAAPSVPHAADRRAGSPPPRQHQSNSDYIEAMRRARGQVPMR